MLLCLYVLSVIIFELFNFGNSIEIPSKCGVSKLHESSAENIRIVGGIKAKPGYFPWLVYLNKTIIYNDFEVQGDCGGSIINSKWILTAAHCLQDVPDNLEQTANDDLGIKVKIDAIFGAINLNEAEKSQVKRSIRRIVRPEFNNVLKKNDIALLELDKKLDFDGNESHLIPICLPDKNIDNIENITTNECYVAGFGYEDQKVETNDYILHYIRDSLVPHRDCDRVFSHYDSKQNLCIGGEFNKGTCRGDSGNAVICLNNHKWTQVGLVSYGIPCAFKDIPDVLTNVVHF